MAKILVTGGCGYIGSHTVIDLIENGFDVVSVDSNIRSDYRMLNSVKKITGKNIKNYQTDICDLESLKKTFDEHSDISGVIHFAAFKSVPESVEKPLSYYHNNINGLLNVLECINKYNIPNFIFSSSCSVYGNTTELPVKENTPLEKAESPYARTKQMCEQIIQDFSVANKNIKSILLRYFNPGGAHHSGIIGEIPQQGAFNVIPILIGAFEGTLPQFGVTGNDHDTPDGSCVRDYIHVMDVGNAHTKALQYLMEDRNENNCEVFNIGIGQGVSVLELIEAFDRATGKKLPFTIGPRRAGDVSAIYADYSRAKELLGWNPRYDVNDIMATAWTWHQTGYQLID
ncbi:UDP-glucose 4-epimerase GalE [Aureispira]|nr:UDP-glucose 4-epimerase GalE [Aureispira sp.]